MKTVSYEKLETMLSNGDKLTATEKAYGMGVIDTLMDVVSILFPEDTDTKNRLCKISNLILKNSSVRYNVGDQIEINLDGFGVFTATAQKVTNDSVIFMFDDCVAVMPMNTTSTNEGGYEKTGLCYWINNVLRKAFPEEIRKKIMDISIPTYSQMFGHDEFYNEYFEPDNDEQFELMRKRTNRMSCYKNKPRCFWLLNAIKKETSVSDFAGVDVDGEAACSDGAAYSHGVRPVFTLSV